MNAEAINYDQLAEAIAGKLRLLPPPDKVIWGAKQCADYLGMGERHFTDKVSKTTKFPVPIRLPTDTGKQCKSRWYAKEIIEWAAKHR